MSSHRRRLWCGLVLLAAVLGLSPRRLPAAQAGPNALSERVYIPQFTLGPFFDLAVSRVEIIQGVTMGDSYTAHVAGRPALMRVFVRLTGGSSLAGVRVRLRRYVAGAQQNEMTAGPLTVHATVNEGNLAHTVNFNLPAGWLTTNASYVVELDYLNSIFELNEGNNRYPNAGQQSFGAASMAPLNVVVVPVTYKGTTPPTGDLSYLTSMPIKVLPVSQINYALRAPFTFNGNLQAADGSGWLQLLSAIRGLHTSENPAGDKLYYGLVDSAVADGCANSCITGIGYVSQPGVVWKTSAGFAGFSASNRADASPTFTHEMGHNFGRRHAPCGNPSGVDGNYPYSGASIGQWGYDTATGQLLSPATYHDYMSYCPDEWTSDYTYHGIAQAWGWLNAGAAMAAGASEPGLLVSGYVLPDGQVQVDPVFAARGQPHTAATGDGRLEWLDAGGQVLAALPVDFVDVIIEAPDGDELAASFSVVAPAVDGLAGLRLYRGGALLYERRAAGAPPRLADAPAQAPLLSGSSHRLGWTLATGDNPVTFRVRFSPDGGASWTVLALETASTEIEVPASVLAGAPGPVLEVQASDGVRSDLQIYDLAPASPR